MELDNAFQFASVLAWEDLQDISKPPSVWLEYDQQAGIPTSAALRLMRATR